MVISCDSLLNPFQVPLPSSATTADCVAWLENTVNVVVCHSYYRLGLNWSLEHNTADDNEFA